MKAFVNSWAGALLTPILLIAGFFFTSRPASIILGVLLLINLIVTVWVLWPDLRTINPSADHPPSVRLTSRFLTLYAVLTRERRLVQPMKSECNSCGSNVREVTEA